MMLTNRIVLLQLEEAKSQQKIKSTREKLKKIAKIKADKESRLEKVFFL